METKTHKSIIIAAVTATAYFLIKIGQFVITILAVKEAAGT